MDYQNLNRIISLAEVKEAQVKAFLSFYYKIFGDERIDEIQERTTNYAQNLSSSFIKEHKDFFDDRQNRIKFYEQMSSIGANKAHSGHRFMEELYKMVLGLEPTNEK